MPNRLSTLPLTLLLLPLAPGPSGADDWPGFRGPAADGAVRRAVLAGDRSLGLRVAWKRPLGSGYSSVSVAGGRAVTMSSDGESDHLVALDQASGRELWRVELGPTHRGRDGSHTGPISTPLIDGGRVYALGPRGRLISVALDTGERAWSVDLVEDLGARMPHYGFSTAPLMAAGVLVVQTGAQDGGAVAGFAPATGEILWQVGDDTIQYQSPVPFTFGETTVVMAAGDKKVMALDPRNGEQFWAFEHEGGGPRGAQSLMPVLLADGRVFLAHRDTGSKVVGIGHADEGVTFEALWENGAIRNSYNVAVYHDGHLYGFSSRFLTCVEAETGKTVWKSRAPGDGFLILVDGHLVIQTKDGSLHVARATPEGYHEVAGLELFDDLAWSPPSFANGSVYLRSLREVARVDVVPGAPSRLAAADDRSELEGTTLGAFLARVERAEDKAAEVDAFLAAQESFPIVEADGLVHFVYRGPAQDVALAGDMIGSRQEAPMRRVEGTDLFYRSTRLEPDARVAYVFLVDYEATLDPRNPNHEVSTVYGRDMELVFRPDERIEMSWVAMPEWQPPTHLDQAAVVRGALDTHQLEVEALEQPVGLAVYLPPGYAEAVERRYPVAYVSGGRAARELGRMDATLDALIEQSLAPLIAVFVDARVPPARYGDLLADDVVPFIDSTYRTRAERDQRASIGVGFPGYAALLAGFVRSEAFGRIGAISPGMLDSMLVPLQEKVPQAEERPLEVYLDWGKYDLRNPHENWDLVELLRGFDRFLRERGYHPRGGETPEGAGWLGYRSRTDDLLTALFSAE